MLFDLVAPIKLARKMIGGRTAGSMVLVCFIDDPYLPMLPFNIFCTGHLTRDKLRSIQGEPVLFVSDQISHVSSPQ